MKLTRGFMKCVRSQQTECRADIRTQPLKPDIKRSVKITIALFFFFWKLQVVFYF